MEKKISRWTESAILASFICSLFYEYVGAETNEQSESYLARIWKSILELWESEPIFIISISVSYIVVLLLLFLLIYLKLTRNRLKKNESKTQLSTSKSVPEPKPKPKLLTDEKNRFVVFGKDVQYSVGKKKILKSINLKIASGEIYGLLGPSGCGKTTLLRLIVGLKSPTKGKMIVFSSKPGSRGSMVPGPGVGYMPQEIALYREFTIQETIEYFGKIYGIRKEERNSRLKSLLKVLDLPDENRFIDNLSGGQKRRTSLAVALINNPPLLILDEPTVGVDPLLRQTIWNHLFELAKTERTTVIITTHYIEETRQAHKIALMRRGQLLVEAKPEELLTNFKVDTLEMAFLKICQSAPSSEESEKGRNEELLQDRETIDLIEKEELAPYPYLSEPSVNILGHCSIIGALSGKSFLRIRRNLSELIFQLILPAFQLILFLVCVGSDPSDINISVYNPDKNYSLDFLQLIDQKVFNIKHFDNFEIALNEVKIGHSWLAIVFDANYTESVLKRFNFGQTYVTNETIDKSKIKIYADMTEFPIQITIMESIAKTLHKYLLSLIERMPFPKNKEVLTAPFVEIVDPPVYGTMKPSFRDFMAPGVIMTLTFMLAVALSSLSFVVERNAGLLERCLIAGVQTYHIVISHFLVQVTVILTRTVIMFFCVFVIFSISFKGNIILALLLVSLQGMSGMSLGFLISAICRDEQMAIFVSVFTFYPTLLLSGIVWPLEGMPLYLKYFSYTQPLTLPNQAFRTLITRGWALNHLTIWLGFVACLAWISIFNASAIIVLKYNK